jgi:glycosyltransferase involved in cell wall biosynthesis
MDTTPTVIHLILGKANPARMNGVNRVVHNQAEYLHRMGVSVEIWGITDTPNDPVADREVPTRLFQSQNLFRGLHPSLMKAMVQLPKNSVVHIHGAFIREFYMASRLLKELKIPYIYTPHGAFNEVALRKNKLIKKLYLRFYEKQILKDAQKIQFLGQSEFDHIGKLVDLSNKVIIPNGQNFEELTFDFEPVQRQLSPVFGFCGRLDIYYKALDVLIDGFAQYVHSGGRGELWLIGDSPERYKLEELVKHFRIEARVKFLGAMYGTEKLNRISNMDVFCHPSRSEGSPTAVLEAGALGRPLIVTNATNTGELVVRYNCGENIGDATRDNICNAMFNMERNFDEGLLPAMGSRARQMVSTEFNWYSIAKQLAGIYSEKA